MNFFENDENSFGLNNQMNEDDMVFNQLSNSNNLNFNNYFEIFPQKAENDLKKFKENFFMFLNEPIEEEREMNDNNEGIKSIHCDIKNNISGDIIEKEKKEEIISKPNKSCPFLSISNQSLNRSTDTKTKVDNDSRLEEILKKYEGKLEIRTDYLKKKYKVYLGQFAKTKLNDLLKKANLKKNFGAFSLPNSKEFTGNVNDSVNNGLLQISVKEMISLGKDKKKGGSLQAKNDRIIKKIFESDENKFTNLKDFLNLSVQNLIGLFEESDKFDEFANKDEITIYLDYYLKKEKGEEYSLRKKGGFIKVIQIKNK